MANTNDQRDVRSADQDDVLGSTDAAVTPDALETTSTGRAPLDASATAPHAAIAPDGSTTGAPEASLGSTPMFP